MNILFVGDVVGRPGRSAVRELLPGLLDEHTVDFCVVNAENSAAGYGVSVSTAHEIFDAGADVLTTGNHVWAQKEAADLLASDERILRPANFSPGVPGAGWGVFETAGGERVGVINLIGRIFMDPADCPFRVAEGILNRMAGDCDAIIIDFHAEATSEKAALGFHLDGRVTAVIGTHTHVQTADAQVLPGGTAYISDCGMTGPRLTCIGVKPEIVIRRFLTGMPARFDVPRGGPAVLSAVVVQTAPGESRACALQPLQILTNGAEEV